MENKSMRFLSLLLALVMVIGLMPVGHVHAEEAGLIKAPEAEAATDLGLENIGDSAEFVIATGRKDRTVRTMIGNAVSGGGKSGVELINDTPDVITFEDVPAAFWTITKVEGGYTISVDGTNNVQINGNNNATLAEGAVVQIRVSENGSYGNGYFEIFNTIDGTNYFLNYFDSFGGVTSSGCAASVWSDNDPGSQWQIYKVTEKVPEIDIWNKAAWTKVSVDTETVNNETEGLFEYAFDGKLNTIWHSNWKNGARDVLTGENTFAGEINFGQEHYINQFSFLPRQDDTQWENGDGVVTMASLYVKDADDTEWKLVAEHQEFEHNQNLKTFTFEAQNVQYVRFVAERSVYDGWVAVSEFYIDYVEPAHEHTYDNDCDDTCNGCEEIREVPDHVYDDDDDAECNECGAIRKLPKHAELTTNIGEIEFVVGEAQEFTFSTIANDDAGIKVIGVSNFSDPDAIEKLEYYEPNTDAWYELNGAFGPADGFPMADATSKFRVTFAKAGEYTFTAVMKVAATGEELCSVEATAVVIKHAELTTNIDEIEFVVGEAQEFTFSTIANSDAGIKVIGVSNFSDPDAIEKLEYYEPNTDAWYELNGAFGPADGFPMADATSKFRVTFAKAGEYTFTAVVKTVEGGEILCSVEATAVVVEPEIIDPNDPWGKSKWVKIHVDTETIDNENEGNFEYAWDNDTNTRWHSNWKGANDVLTGSNTISGSIDFTREYKINQFSFLPRQDDTGWANGDGVVTMASLYKGTLNEDGTYTWEPLAEHVEFEHNQQWKTFTFPEQNVRYIKFVAERSVYNGWVVVSEFDINYVPVAPCEHTPAQPVKENEVPATCTEDGSYDSVVYCSVCGEKLSSETIPVPAAHTPADPVKENETPATCTKAGSYDSVVYCSVCEAEISRTPMPVDMLEHTPSPVKGTPATFDAPGLTDGESCSVCGTVLVAQEPINKLDYNEGIVPVEVLTATAGDIDYNMPDSQGPAEFVLDDNFGTLWHTDWYGNSRDNHWIQFELSDWYAVGGLRYKPRTDLNREGQPQLNGTITEFKIQISNDGVNFEDVITGNWEANQNWKTVEFEAVTAKYIRLVAIDACTDNDSVFASAAEIRLVGVETEAPPCGHTKTEIRDAKAATCTEAGYTGDTYCADCDEKLADGETVAALGHKEEVVPAKAATCTETGLTEGKKCSVCDEILVAQEEIAALDHDFVNGDCNLCDAVQDAPFEDVPAGAFYFDPVLWAVEKGVTTGATETTFNPNGECQRAAVVTFLWRAAGSPEPTTTENPFTDVKESDFYYKAVLWAVENNITNGLSADTFGPMALCNRAQVVTFLWRAMEKPESDAEVSFTDVKEGQFYSTAVAWAVENEITNGISATAFGVDNICNRAQVVTFLYRTLAD